MSNNEERNVNRDWSLDINLSGVSAPTGAGNVEVPDGYYRADIVDVYTNPDKPERVIFKLSLQGEFAGVIRTDGMTKPRDAQDKVRYYWRGLAESAGYTPAQLDAGEIKLNLAAFQNKTVHIHYTAKKGDDQRERISYLPPAVWNQRVQATKTGNDAQVVNTHTAGTTSKAAMLDALDLS